MAELGLVALRFLKSRTSSTSPFACISCYYLNIAPLNFLRPPRSQWLRVRSSTPVHAKVHYRGK